MGQRSRRRRGAAGASAGSGGLLSAAAVLLGTGRGDGVSGRAVLVREGDADNIIGVLKSRDFLDVGKSGVPHDLRGLLIETPVVRDGMNALDVLESHCSENGIDLLAAGAVRHGANHQVIFGSLTSEILSRGPSLPTLLAG